MEKMRIAIIGQGRSGRDIHGKFYKSENNDIIEVAAVIEANKERRERALNEYPGCKVYESYKEIIGMDFDLVVNASYSNMHYEITKDLLKAGFNVLCEKPFSRNYIECADLIKTAKENNCILSVFHQSNTSPFYLGAKEVYNSGKLGEILQVNFKYNGFSRRWDWQTLQCMLAGSLYNTGPHPVGMALDIIDYADTQVVYSKLDRALTSGDGEDFVKIILTAPNKPLIDIEITSVDAYSDYNIKLIGTKGTYKCTTAEYKMKYIVDGENPEREVVRDTLVNEDGFPVFCSEELKTHEEDGKFNGSPFDVGTEEFYRKMYASVMEGKELYVKPENIAKVMGVMETVHGQNPLSLKF